MTVLRNQKLGGVRWLKKSVREALQLNGELALYYQMYNPQNAEGVERCSHCYEPAYAQPFSPASEGICPYCFNTTYEGGIKQAFFAPLLISKPDIADNHQPYGDLAEQSANVYLPDYITAWKGDFVVRINGFNLVSENPFKITPEAVEVWEIETPQVSIVKDGLSQIGSFQRIGTNAKASLVNIPHPIAKVAFSSPYLSLFTPTPKQGPLLNASFASLSQPQEGSQSENGQ